jgi:hypothetical protein
MHPNPEHPEADAAAPYGAKWSSRAEAFACAAEAPAGGLLFFQAWAAPCRWLQPFPGNACMHLEPIVAESLASGESAEIRGLIGMHEGSRQLLEDRLRRFRAGEAR